MNIFEALRESHDQQRHLSEKLVQTSGDSDERQQLFDALRNELYAHSVAEDRYLYIPLMFNDTGLDITRHALAEHHEMDEMVEELEQTDMSSPSWIATAKKLADKVHHHLKEEEHKFFQQAGKILDDAEKEKLGKQYLNEYAKYKKTASV
ncbi:hemerythrin domain-containing protein [Acinetobacter soli]|uniref:Hemerythrin domain-containing protein n=1 Tax=Acinetobacter soli TaxID=487316 RepID=A0AB38YZP0_9GAMM|nr:hemerythrin domain-containing protein [Acinetobacter soli]KQD01626.1 hemerythrin [Acinetobacter soli]MDQ8941647.1 hemerythrin domain-containing protein [Acinetobacter soli]WEH91919.1 hemerythrin domain-containing protein [Acinetobacter soli]WEH98939.1 hemerythrin domain-containing protein [Acinetobacter soli]WEI00461.1 hemerythrin domain-containing protein [Acinetobacter soli]